MPGYRRYWVPGGTYFFTVNLLERHRTLLVDEVALLRRVVQRVRTSYPFRADAWVVLPDHMHCVWTMPPNDANFALRWQLIKLLFARALPATERRSTVRLRRGERGVWQRRYWEHCIRDARDFRHHIDYLHWNPLKHGHVTRVQDWPYSSFHRYVRQGVYPLDWAGDAVLAERVAPHCSSRQHDN